jgi:hypothetical protein
MLTDLRERVNNVGRILRDAPYRACHKLIIDECVRGSVPSCLSWYTCVATLTGGVVLTDTR